MGRSKALLPWRHSTLLDHHWTLFRSLENCKPWIVTSHNDLPLTAELDRIDWPFAQRITNPIAPAGSMADSIRYGIVASLRQDCSAVGIALIDQPFIAPLTFQRLEETFRKHPKVIVQPTHEHRRGHPVLLPREMAEEFLHGNHKSLKTFLSEKEGLRKYVAVDNPGILTDLDTPEDYIKYEPRGCP